MVDLYQKRLCVSAWKKLTKTSFTFFLKKGKKHAQRSTTYQSTTYHNWVSYDVIWPTNVGVWPTDLIQAFVERESPVFVIESIASKVFEAVTWTKRNMQFAWRERFPNKKKKKTREQVQGLVNCSHAVCLVISKFAIRLLFANAQTC